MATVYYNSFDLIRVDANGQRVTLASTTISAYNVTADASLGTIASGTDGVVVSGSFTADVNDVVRFTHATYPLEHYVVLKSTKEEAFAAAENAPVYILENLYTNTNEARAIHLYVEDTANPSKEPVLMGTGRPGETLLIPYQSNVSKTLNVHHLTQDDYGRLDAHEFKALTPVEVEVEPIDFSAATPYKISQFTTATEPDFADLITTVGSDLAMLWIDMEVEYTGSAVTLPTNIRTTVEKGGKIINSGGTITINSFSAPPNVQVFDGTGDVIVRAPELHLGWWAESVSTGNDQHAYDQFVASGSYTASSQTYGVILNQGSGKRWFNVAEVPSGTTWTASGQGADPVDSAGGTHGFTAFPLVTTSPVFKLTGSKNHIHFEGFSIFSSNTAECVMMEFAPATVQVNISFKKMTFYRNSHGSSPTGKNFPTRLVEIIGTSSGGDITGLSFTDCWFRALDDVALIHLDCFNSALKLDNCIFLWGKTGNALQLERFLSVSPIHCDWRGGGGYSYSGYTTNTSIADSVTVTTTSGSPDLVASSGSFDSNMIGQPISGTGIPAGAFIIGIGPTLTTEYTTCVRAKISANATSSGAGRVMTINRKGVRTNQEGCCIYVGSSGQTLNVYGGLEEGTTTFLDINTTGFLCNANLYGVTPQALIRASTSCIVNLYGGYYFSNSIIPDSGCYMFLSANDVNVRPETFGETVDLVEAKLVGPTDSGGVIKIVKDHGYRPGTSNSLIQKFGQSVGIWDPLTTAGINTDIPCFTVASYGGLTGTDKCYIEYGWLHPETGEVHHSFRQRWRQIDNTWLHYTFNHPDPSEEFEHPVRVPDEAYDATAWNGNMEVPTKNAIRDKIEAMGSGGFVNTANSPNANEFARFTDADTIEGLTQAEMKTALAYGTMADQAASAVNITGGSITDTVISTGSSGALQITNTDPGTPRALNLAAAGATQSATRSLIFNVNNASRTLDLSGNLTVGSGGATVSGTQSGTNTGDNAVNSNYSGLAASKLDAARTVVSTGSTANPSASDTGKEYRLTAASMNLPASAGCTAGLTVFYVTTLSTNASITPNGSDVLQYWDTGTDSAELASGEVTIYQTATAEVRYMGSGIWSVRAVKLTTP
jgi:hypothetical protein